MLSARTRNNLADASHTLKHIVARLFNVLFGWNLKNLNTEMANYPGVDLADRERRLAVQVTNNASPRKIEDTGNAGTRLQRVAPPIEGTARSAANAQGGGRDGENFPFPRREIPEA
ncbi:MAG: SMEK domain-containing protein, partial [Chthoniobacter sp.]